MPNDLTGERFGLLVAVSRTQKTLSSGRKMPAWVLDCDCGNQVVAITTNLSKGKHQSCGKDCPVKAKQPRDRVKNNPLYPVYRQMLDRCYLKTAPNYAWYGARGIGVCARWRDGEDGLSGFRTFLADMGERPDGMTLDRVNVDGDYAPENCRWASWGDQQRNRRNTVYLEAFGEILPVADWADRYGVPCRLIRNRLKRGWPVARAISEPKSIFWSRHKGCRAYGPRGGA